MAAIITDDFRRNQAKLLVNDIKASADAAYDASDLTSTMQDRYRENSNYAIGLGKTDSWPNDINGASEDTLDFIIKTPDGTLQETEDVINNLFTLKEIGATAVSQLIAKNTWTLGRKYKAYDGSDNDCFYVTGDIYPSYAVHNGNIYLCLSNSAQSGATSEPIGATIAPSDTSQGIQSTGDSYVWAHIQSLPTAAPFDKFTTPQFAPILEETDNSRIANSTTKQGGLLSCIGITNGGTGYTSTTTVSVTIAENDGSQTDTSGYIFKPIISGNGVIERIEMQFGTAQQLAGDNGSLTYWQNVIKGNAKSATVVISDANQPAGAQQATAFAKISPTLGYAAKGIDILPSWFVGCIAEFQGNEGGDAQPLKFRQVSLLKNFVRTEDNENPQTLSSYDALKYINVNGANFSTTVPGDVISQASSGAKFYFNSYLDGKLYFHQNTDPEVNFLDPNSGGTETKLLNLSSNSVEVATDVAVGSNGGVVQNAEYGHRVSNTNSDFNGKVIFHENRIPFQRTATQTEEVKLIIQL